MLDLTTCKALKQAGFPQIGETYLCMDDHERQRTLPRPTEGAVLRPTLEDLLRELGEDFKSLEVLLPNETFPNRGFVAWGWYTQGCEGDTPEQALANLYLTLYVELHETK